MSDHEHDQTQADDESREPAIDTDPVEPIEPDAPVEPAEPTDPAAPVEPVEQVDDGQQLRDDDPEV